MLGTNVIKDVAGNNFVGPTDDNDTVTVDATAPSVSSITDNVSGGPTPQNVPITFTVNFSEDIDLASVSAGDFDNAGTATVTFGAITEPTPGTLSVVVTPTSGGTLQLRIPTGATIADVVGNALAVPVLDDTTINITAVTTLTAGDIAFTGIATDAPDTFSFVLLKDVTAGTTITFTDNGWGNNAFANTSEQTLTVTFSAARSAGTHLVISDNTTSATFFLVGTTTSAGTVVGNLNGLSASGDSILAYQGAVPTSNNASNWLAGINTRSFAANPANTNQSDLPSALQLGVTAIQLSNTATDIDNWAYSPATFTGTPAQARASIYNIANWSSADAPPYPLSTTVFTIGADTFPPTVTFDDGDPDDTVVAGETLTYTIAFNEDIDASTVSVADFINSGTSTVTFGTLTPATSSSFTLQVTPTSGGTVILQIPTGAVIQDLAGNALVVPATDDTTVTVTTADLVPPTVISIDDGDADNLVAANAPLTYTITFSEDIDSATVSAADFDNAGTATLTFGAITETTPGVFTVLVTPTSAGTLILRIPSGATITDVAGNPLATPVQDNDTLTVDATAPTVTSITDNVTGGPIFQGQAVTYTIVFSEDINAATVSAADFDNAGTATIAIGTITETTPGTFTVVVTPTTGGSLTLRMPSTAVISDVVGNNVVVPFSDDTTITVNATTTLTVGDVSIIGFRSDADDGFAFVPWVDLLPGTAINFWDSGYIGGGDGTGQGPGGGTWRTAEDFVTWTNSTGSTITAGTVIVVSLNTTDLGIGHGPVAGLALSTAGDQIFAGQGAFVGANPSTFSGTLVFGLDFNATVGWDTSAADTQTSGLPSVLNVTATGNLSLNGLDNGQYTAGRSFSIVADAKTSVQNTSNYTLNDDGAAFGPLISTDFTLGL